VEAAEEQPVHHSAMHHSHHLHGAVSEARQDAVTLAAVGQMAHTVGTAASGLLSGGDEEDGWDLNDGGADGTEDGFVDSAMDFMDNLTRHLEKLQKIGKILIKCVALSPACAATHLITRMRVSLLLAAFTRL
jgi:hypothetical protein